MWGFPLPDDILVPSPEVDLRPELCASHACAVCVLLGLLLILRALVEDREYHRLQDDHGGRLADHGAWSISVRSCCIRCFVPAVFDSIPCSRSGDYGSQVSANPYVDLLGKPETASSRLDLTQAFNSLGTTIAPKIGGLLILSAAPLAIEQLRQLTPQALHAYRVQQAASVKLPYVVIGVALLLLAVLIGISRLPKIENTTSRFGERGNDSIWKHPNLVFGAIGIFAYVGAEVSIGSFLVNYFGLPEIAGFSAKTAAGFVSFFWGGSMLGRFLGAGLLQRFRPRYLLALCAVVAGALVTASMLLSGHIAMWSILAVGFFNSIMFPTIFSLGEAELGPLSGSGSGILNMAIVGGAILPVIQGAIADHVGLHHAFVLPLICYLYIVFYALSGSKPNSQRNAKS